jgi:hypothetical protein
MKSGECRMRTVGRPCLFGLALALAWSATARAEPIAAVDIGSRRELFVDRLLVDRMEGAAELRMHRPQDEGVVYRFDAPWEGAFCAYVTVIRDGGKYRMYYRGAGTSSGKDTEGVTCCAESTDGVRWTRPELDLYPAPGGGRTNIVLADAGRVPHNFSPFLDTRPGVDPDQRYKAVGGYDDVGLFAYVSADGMRWRRLGIGPVMSKKQAYPSFVFDSQNVAFWSEAEGKYLLYYRTYKDRTRRICRAESDDFVRWTNSKIMEYRRADGGPAPVEQLYTSQTHPYFRAPHVYVATAARIMLGRRVITTRQAEAIGVHSKYFNDTSDAVLLTSRCGSLVYDRTFMDAFIAPGIGPENWVSRTNYPALNVVQTGPAEMSVYANQNYGQPTACLHRYSLRLDGFASAHGGFDGGEVVTRPLTFKGSRLYLNFATSAAGAVRVEVQDERGAALPGFSKDDCTEIVGNEIERAVEWKGGDLDPFEGKPVRLRFVLADADVFSFRFGQDEKR